MSRLVIVVAQINLTVGDIKGNAKQIIAATQEAVEQHQADLVLFPELALTGYPPEDLLLRPGFHTRVNKALIEIIQSTKKTSLVLGYPKQEKMACYNTAAVIQNGRIITCYAKQLLPNDTVFDEKRYFFPGSKPCIFTLKGVQIGINICEDLWHEGPAQAAVDAGAQIILSLNASPYDRNKIQIRQSVLETCTRQLKIPIVYCNLVGGQDELVFDGGSMVMDAQGTCILQAPYYQEALMPVKINHSHKKLMIEPQPLPSRLTEEANLYQALVLGVRDYVNKNNFPGVLIGLSGGIDSALTLLIAYDALGHKRLHTVMMPTRFTSKMSLEDAQAQAKILAVKHDVIPIDPLFESYLIALKHQFKQSSWNCAEENIQSRIRGNLLMAISNKKGFMVLATGNKSELSVGYATLYGDMSGGFAPLKDIPKTMVYRLANYRNSLNVSEWIIPKRVIERAPSAELAEGQKDQDTLPPYEILDKILNRYIEQDQDPQILYAAGFDPKTVDYVITRVNNNEYKRRQAPIGIRTTQRAFGKDRRYPITSGYYRNI